MVLSVGNVAQLRELLPSTHKALGWIMNTTEHGWVVVKRSGGLLPVACPG